MIPQYLTFSEYNYLHLGLTLYESICKHSTSDFVLHYIVRDEKSYNILTSINKPNLKVYRYEECKAIHKDFEKLEKTHQSNLESFSPFHFMMTPVSVKFMLEQGLDHCLYIDSDICFYADPKLVIDAVHGKSVGICTHKHMPFQKSNKDVGYYNVGVIYFKNDAIGKKCAQWWSDVCLNPSNKWSSIYGFCGDQKYLEVFEDIIGKNNIKIIDYDIGHGAPWNFWMLDFLENDEIIWHDDAHFVLKDTTSKRQKMVYNHFSHFKPNFENNTYSAQREGEWECGRGLFNHKGVRELYDRYMADVVSVYNKYMKEESK